MSQSPSPSPSVAPSPSPSPPTEPRNLNEYTDCYYGKRPDFCENIKWYESQPSACVNCWDVNIFKALYNDPQGSTVDPDTGEIQTNNKLYNFLKELQEPLDTTMEFMQLYLFIIILSVSLAFAFTYGVISRRRIPNAQIRSDIAVDAIGFGNGLFPRLIFAIVFSYIVEGIIKLKNYRARPNLTRGMVSDYDRWMGPNDFTDVNSEEERDFFARSKGPILGLRSHRSSFPSGHNTGAWTLFWILAFSPMYTDFTGTKQPWGKLMNVLLIIFLVLAVYQFYARISLGGWHWPSDIAAGVLLGMVSALFGGLVWSKPGFLLLLAGVVICMLWVFCLSSYKLLSVLQTVAAPANLVNFGIKIGGIELVPGVLKKLGERFEFLKELGNLTSSDINQISAEEKRIFEGFVYGINKVEENIRIAADGFTVICFVITLFYLKWLYTSVKTRSVGIGPGSYAYVCTLGLNFILMASLCVGFLYPDEAIVSTERWAGLATLDVGDSSALLATAINFAYPNLIVKKDGEKYGWWELRMPLSFPIRNLDPIFKKIGVLPNAMIYNCAQLNVPDYDYPNSLDPLDNVHVYAQSYWDYEKSARDIAIERCTKKQTISQELQDTKVSIRAFVENSLSWYLGFAFVVMFFLYLPRYWGEIYNVQKQSSESKWKFALHFLFNLLVFLILVTPLWQTIKINEYIEIGQGWWPVLVPLAALFLFKILVAVLSYKGIIAREQKEYRFEDNKDLSLLRFLKAQV